jgi:hypothetical protein
VVVAAITYVGGISVWSASAGAVSFWSAGTSTTVDLGGSPRLSSTGDL